MSQYGYYALTQVQGHENICFHIYVSSDVMSSGHMTN